MFKKILATAAIVGTGLAQAYTPQTGTWIVSSELNGKPGRGLAIDVQGTTLVMQMYAYDASGNSTFYLTSGTIADHKYSGTLNKYRGGRHLGSGDLSGQESGNDGVVSMRFLSGTKGYIKFPNEAEKEISRFSFAYSSAPDSLKGIWLFTPLNSLTPIADFVKLENVMDATTYGSGLVASKDYRFACENITRGANVGTVLCLKLNASGKTSQIYQFTYSVNDGEGLTGASVATANNGLVVRRLTDINADGTGIMFKNTTSDTPIDPEALRDAFEDAALQLDFE